jgi:poly-gamma-glutamate capsule biosynthesis protein CapA/YwtB (metallophosphatase superfamily)
MREADEARKKHTLSADLGQTPLVRSRYTALCLLSLACACSRVAGEAPARPATSPPRSAPAQAEASRRATVRLAAIGDVLPHKRVKRTARMRARTEGGRDLNHMGFDAIFGGLRETIEPFDIATYNMETPVTRDAYKPPMRLRFWTPPGMPQSLEAAGFDVAVCANNHQLDQGRDALPESIGHLREARLATVGCGSTLREAAEPVILERHGIRVGILAFSRILNAYDPRIRDRPEVPQILFWYDFGDEGREVLDAVRALRASGRVDVIVVNAHWDREYVTSPLPATRGIARQVIEAGADVIIGHHPHVLQPGEYMRAADGRRAAVVYSLGNFISDMCPGRSPSDLCERRLGAIAMVTFTRDEAGRTALSDVAFEPTWTEHRDGCDDADPVEDHCVLPVVLGPAIARLRALPGPADEDRQRLIDGYTRRRDVILRHMGPHEARQ